LSELLLNKLLTYLHTYISK